jgi:hypothetical protein
MLGETPAQYHVVPLKSHMTWPGGSTTVDNNIVQGNWVSFMNSTVPKLIWNSLLGMATCSSLIFGIGSQLSTPVCLLWGTVLLIDCGQYRCRKSYVQDHENKNKTRCWFLSRPLRKVPWWFTPHVRNGRSYLINCIGLKNVNVIWRTIQCNHT